MDRRLAEAVRLLSPPPGQPPWAGGATILGCLRGVTPAEAAWLPAPKRHGIWRLVLHLAYWKYAVRRRLEDSAQGSYPRKPANWPALPHPADEPAWRKDRALLKNEHELLLGVIRSFDPDQLDERTPGSGKYRYADLIYGIAMHDTHHIGQIQLLKRLCRQAEPRA